MPYYQAPIYSPEFTEPPPYPVRTMAEWEELQGIMITWTSFHSILRQIVDYAQEECTVYIVCSDSNSVKTYLSSGGVPLFNLRFLQTSFNSIWIRDYGPWTTYSVPGDTLNIMDWKYNRPRPYDDVIPATFASLIQAPFFATTTPPYDLTHTGGNFMTDGHGTGFSSNLVLEENPGKTAAEIDTIMRKFMGIHRFIKMEVLPYDLIHHIDMHMKLLDEETLLVGEYPPGVSDGPQIEANLAYILNNFQTCFGRQYRVVRIPMPPDQQGRYPSQGGDYRTYTNGIIINRTVIIPTYELRYDTTAFRIYREAMPGYRIAGINSNAIIPLSGAIHCIVKEVGSRHPIHISHAAVRTASDTAQVYPIVARIVCADGISTAQVFWSTDTSQGFSVLPMTAMPNDTFRAEIPGRNGGDTVYYYISAESQLPKTITKPMTAPTGAYRFVVEGVTRLTPGSEIGGLTRRLQVSQNFPNPFNPKTVIHWQMSVGGPVLLTVHNLSGQTVAVLVDRHLAAGNHSIEFNGSEIASGVYFYRIQSGNPSTNSGAGFVELRKMILLK